ncbi:MAG: type 1 glutamine amidotransferase [Bdellovibrionota bacterium]
MRNVLVLQHVAHEPLGTLHSLLKKSGLRIKYVNFEREPNAEPKLEGYNGLVILGGPMGAYETNKHPHLKHEMKLIEQAMKKNIPVLGICLGAQLIASTLKADVKRLNEGEVGWHPVHLTPHGHNDPMFKHFKKSETIFQMHGDGFETPSSAEHLAFSEICPGQAFRYGEKTYGLQFHLEVEEAMIHRWLKIHNIPGDKILGDTNHHMKHSLELSTQAFGQFISLFNLPERGEILGSEHKPKGRGSY